MEDDSGIGCSIWLIPEKNAAKKITPIISSLSAIHGSPLFEPHITLIKGIPITKNIIKNFKTFFDDKYCFDLSPKSINTDIHYFKCIFLEIEKNKELLDLRNKVEKFFKVIERTYEPHISLLYSDVPLAERKQEAKNISIDLSKITINKIKLYKTIGKVYSWEELASISLKKKSDI